MRLNWQHPIFISWGVIDWNLKVKGVRSHPHRVQLLPLKFHMERNQLLLRPPRSPDLTVLNHYPLFKAARSDTSYEATMSQSITVCVYEVAVLGEPLCTRDEPCCVNISHSRKNAYLRCRSSLFTHRRQVRHAWMICTKPFRSAMSSRWFQLSSHVLILDMPMDRRYRIRAPHRVWSCCDERLEQIFL